MQPIDDLMKSYYQKQAYIGAAVAILQEGKIVYLGGFGNTCIEDYGSPITSQTLFAYGSISKTICATLVMRLVETGLLELDRPVVDYLPDFRFSRNDFGMKITLRHLLSHTSGLPMAGKYWGPRDPDSLRRFVYEQIPLYEFLTEPGTVHLYSNTVICIAGHVAEAVTGKFYDDLVQEYVFDPLQMTRSTYDPAVAFTFPNALAHKEGPDGELQVFHRVTYNVSGNPSGFAYGSVIDLAHLAQMYLNQGESEDERFLTASSIAEMHMLHASRLIEGHAHPAAQVNLGYGLGFNVGNYKGRRAARHGGMNLSFNCFFDLFPDDGAGVVLLTNYSRDEQLMELVVDLYDHALGLPQQGIVYIDKPLKVSPSPGAQQQKNYVGAYLNIESGDLATVEIAENTFMLIYQGKSLSLVQFGDNQFYAEISERYRLMVTFVENLEGKVSYIMIGGNPYFPANLDPSFNPQPHLWKAYEGVYKDPSNWNKDDIFTVRNQDDVLVIAEGEHEVTARPLGNRCFLCELGLIQFEDTGQEEVKILVWGKATRYYPIDGDVFRAENIIRYLVEVPQA